MSALTAVRLTRLRPLAFAVRTDQHSRLLSGSGTALTSDPAPATTPVSAGVESKKKLSMAMKFYLEKKRDHDAFIARERSEFEMGKKHLANMMGMEAEAMTQADIDKAIEYLFPSGLYLPNSRPMMKPPEEVKLWRWSNFMVSTVWVTVVKKVHETFMPRYYFRHWRCRSIN